MFRLIKLATLALAAYTIYEFYQGFARGGSAQPVKQDDRSGPASDEGGRMSVLTGAGGGKVELSEDSSGAIIPNHVGRGVKM